MGSGHGTVCFPGNDSSTWLAGLGNAWDMGWRWSPQCACSFQPVCRWMSPSLDLAPSLFLDSSFQTTKATCRSRKCTTVRMVVCLLRVGILAILGQSIILCCMHACIRTNLPIQMGKSYGVQRLLCIEQLPVPITYSLLPARPDLQRQDRKRSDI